jgi:hypothetical protein
MLVLELWLPCWLCDHVYHSNIEGGGLVAEHMTEFHKQGWKVEGIYLYRCPDHPVTETNTHGA